MKPAITYIFAILALTGYGQNNLIPNGNFESTPLTSVCQVTPVNTTNPPSLFNNSVNDWQTAIHHNGSSGNNEVGQISLQNITICPILTSGETACGAFPSLNNTGNGGTNFVLIRANYKYCSLIAGISKLNGAIGVSLANGAVFPANTTFIFRYKIVPLASRNLAGNNTDPFCQRDNNGGLFCHIRFFLNSNSPANWQNGSYTQQELYSVNFQKQLSEIPQTTVTSCAWQQEERVFSTGPFSGLKTLIIYVESGGAAIDDVEIFTRCDNYVDVQNKDYVQQLFGAGRVSGSNMSEKAGSYIIAGNNITPTRPPGDVVIEAGSKVNYTAGSAVDLKPGFTAYAGAEFHAVPLSCPNTLNRTIAPVDINKNPDPDYIPSPPMQPGQPADGVTKALSMGTGVPSRVFPNPTNNAFTYQAESITKNSKFTVINMINQVVIIKHVEQDKTEMNFDISELSRGVYFLNHYDASGTLITINKIVKE